MRFGKKDKLSLRYIGLYESLEKVGNVAYRVALPSKLEGVHLVFYISMLRKYIPDSSHVIHPQEVQLDETLSYEEVLVSILDKQAKKLSLKDINGQVALAQSFP